MTTNYTNVDRLILEKWEDVLGLRLAFDELQKRIEEVLQEVGIRLERWAKERSYTLKSDPKEAGYISWRPAWETRKREAAIWLEVRAVAPIGYRKVEDEHPTLSVVTWALERLKLKEPDREAFAHELKKILGEKAHVWDKHDREQADWALGRYCTEVTERQRIEMIGDPDKLFAFVCNGFEELFLLSDAVNQVFERVKG